MLFISSRSILFFSIDLAFLGSITDEEDLLGPLCKLLLVDETLDSLKTFSLDCTDDSEAVEEEMILLDLDWRAENEFGGDSSGTFWFVV